MRTTTAKICSAMAAFCVCASSHAGLVWFSRANCVNNESISWDWPGREHLLWTASHHTRNGRQHPVQTGWQRTSHSAAVHWGEGLSEGWSVAGDHFEYMEPYGEHHLGTTQASDCNSGTIFPKWPAIPPEAVPPPPPALRGPLAWAADGISHAIAAPDRVEQFARDLQTVRSGSTGLPKLSFTPASVPSGALLSAWPQGTLVMGAWTGLERYFAMPGSGHARVSEYDLAASGGRFTIDRQMVNATVAGQAAVAVVFLARDGRWIEEVVWADDRKLVTLTWAPELRPGGAGLVKTDPGASALALAARLH